ncbi:MAG: ornithine cyclodeaminase family protein [Actinomycetes bacterium]
MALPHIDAEAVARHAPIPDVVEAVRAAFAASPDLAGRSHLPLSGSDDLLLMPAADATAVGVKVLTVLPGNTAAGRPAIQGCYLLFDRRTGAPVATVDGAALTKVRTPAVSALATQALARTDVRRLAVFGTGVQARAHVPAMLWARPSITSIDVVGRTQASGEDLAGELRAAGHRARAVDPAEGSAAELICTCTSSPDPVVVSARVPLGAHVNAVGSYRPERRELDAELVGRARCVVDERDAAEAEAGDLVAAVRAGRLRWDDVTGDLVGLARGTVLRETDAQVTIFKSVGLAHEDLVAAAMVARRTGLLAG